jgi:thiol-disulfide isomerase/thioredoxin
MVHARTLPLPARSVVARAVTALVLAFGVLFALRASAAPPSGPGWLGLRLEAATADEQKALGVERAVPKVVRTFANSPAEAAGVKPGDFVLAFQGADIADTRDLVTRVGGTPSGTTVSIEVSRSGERVKLETVLVPRPDQQELLRGDWVGKAIPAITLLDAQGNGRIDLGALKGNVVVIDFFATWCGPCKRLSVDLQRLRKELGSSGFEIVSVSSEDADVVKGYSKEHPMPYRVGIDDEKSFEQAFSPSVMPTIWIVDRDGVVRGAWLGIGEYATIERTIRQLVAAPRGASK